MGCAKVWSTLVVNWICFPHCKVILVTPADQLLMIQIIGVALQYISKTGGVLLAGKIINGVAVGALLAIGTTYASEASSTPRLPTVHTRLMVMSDCTPKPSWPNSRVPRLLRCSDANDWSWSCACIRSKYC